MKDKRRKLIKTFPGMPPGAGVYDDGCFYNCAPGYASQSIDHEDERFYTIDDASGKLVYDREDPMFKNVQGGFSLVGVNIDDITELSMLEELMSANQLGDFIADYILMKQMYREPTTVFRKMVQARLKGDSQLADSLYQKLLKRKLLGFRLVGNNKKD